MLSSCRRIEEFDGLRVPKKPRLSLRRGAALDYSALASLLGDQLEGPTADQATVGRVIATNPNSLMLMSSKDGLKGFWAMLMLTPTGLEALLTGEFNGLCPDQLHLAGPTERPAAIYVWMLVCPGLGAEGICHVSEFLRQPLYRFANLYSRPTTKAGLVINLRRGFRPIGNPELGLLRYVRWANQQRAQRLAA